LNDILPNFGFCKFHFSNLIHLILKMKNLIALIIFWAFTSYNLNAQNFPRQEYPRPQFERSAWLNLNGIWSYSFDFGNSGKARGFVESKGFIEKITVPFCPESKLSGVEYKDFINNMWYHRQIAVPIDWANKKVILHFGAVYYKAEVYIDGLFAGRHFGGTSSFEFDITSLITPGKPANLVVYVNDDLRSGKQPGGKQCSNFFSEGCSYTRVTGIWQTVWMEGVSQFGLKQVHIVPDIDQNQLVVYPSFYNESNSHNLTIRLKDGIKVVAEKTVKANNSSVMVLPVKILKTWSPENPFLYDLELVVTDDQEQVVDEVRSYVGMRKVHIEGNRIFLNNKPYYQRLVLDQGFYPDGIWTAPTDGALKHDIELSMQAGFNGARLHQKVFEERYHYWADKLGYITWGESSSWGFDINDEAAARNFIAEWYEIVMRDRNYPSIVTWTPFNETWSPSSEQYPRMVQDIYKVTKAIDPTRPINDASGDSHVVTDIWSVHNYEQNPAQLSEILTPDKNGEMFTNYRKTPFSKYSGQPYLIDEFGGISCAAVLKAKSHQNSWGYGESPKDLEEFYTRLEGQVNAILGSKSVWGFCYTQLTDVEQEQNGIYFYDRSSKFDMNRIQAIFSKSRGENK